jgi:CTP:molybdopterin cytidylyltransferase MocA
MLAMLGKPSKTMHATDRYCHAIVLAGSRPGRDPLLEGSGVSSKALLPVGGAPMLAHVLAALCAHPAIKDIVVLAQDAEGLGGQAGLRPLNPPVPISFLRSGAGISRSISETIDKGENWPILLTTADNVLLNVSMIDDFLGQCSDSDIAVGMVERRTLIARYPQNKRTWLKFRGGWWSGANLFWLGNEKVRPLLTLWASIEADRKKGWRIIRAFGPLVLAGALLRVLDIHQAMAIVSRRFGLTARVVPMRDAEACIDVDKPSDLVLAEEILRRRGADELPSTPLR